MCGGILIGGLLDVLELEAVVEVAQSQTESQYQWGRRRRRRRGSRTCEKGTTGSDRERWLPDIQCNYDYKSVNWYGGEHFLRALLAADESHRQYLTDLHSNAIHASLPLDHRGNE